MSTDDVIVHAYMDALQGMRNLMRDVLAAATTVAVVDTVADYLDGMEWTDDEAMGWLNDARERVTA